MGRGQDLKASCIEQTDICQCTECKSRDQSKEEWGRDKRVVYNSSREAIGYIYTMGWGVGLIPNSYTHTCASLERAGVKIDSSISTVVWAAAVEAQVTHAEYKPA